MSRFNKLTLKETLKNATISTNAKGSNAVFSTGTDSKIYISDSKITTTGSGSARGLDATYGGYIEADNVTLMTTLEKMLPKKEVKTKEEVYADILTAYKKLKIQNTRLNQYSEKGISEIQAEIYNRRTNLLNYNIFILKECYISGTIILEQKGMS